MKQTIGLLYILLIFSVGYAHEFQYQYPVAFAQEQGIIYCLSQLSSDVISLHGLNCVTQEYESILDHYYKPASLTIMPKQGFSFIDNGRIRICKQKKSTPETLILTMPLYDISLLRWIDQCSFYCSAKKRMRYGVFEVDSDGHVTQLLYSITADYMYPYKIGSDFFYIERSDMEDGLNYEIIHTMYAHKRLSEPRKIIADFGERPIIFLHMTTPQEGFVIEYPSKIATSADQVTFTCHHILENSDGKWEVSTVFMFTLPMRLFSLNGPEKLYESLLPLMPCYDADSIYFMHESPGSGINLYAFCKADGNIEQKTWGIQGQVVCSPKIINGRIWYGGTGGVNFLT